MTEIQPQYRGASQVLLPALGLGMAGDFLLREGPLGPSLVLWLLLLTAAALWLTHDYGKARRRTLLMWSTLALAAALLTTLRDLDVLNPLLLFVVLGCAVMTSLETSGISLRAARVRDYLVAGLCLLPQLLVGAPQLLKQANPSATLQHPHMPSLLRGLMLALPLLLVFGALFAAADAGFSRHATRFTNILSPTSLLHLVLIVVFAWLAASLLRIACRNAPEPDQQATTQPPALRVGALEMHVVLALVCALFVIFVLLQLGYLFGGSEMILRSSGLTVAQYARRGFFELIAIAALTLALLLVASSTDCSRTVLRRYGAALIVCVMVILASALQRLWLYTDAFGLTLSRFSALLAILWLVINLLSFAATVLRDKADGFASGVAISLLSCLLLLALANPAALVTRINLQHSAEHGTHPDVAYLLTLGADALPLLLEQYENLGPAGQCQIAGHVTGRYHALLQSPPATQPDWRHWNLARRRATAAVQQHWPAIASSCAAVGGTP